MKFGNPAVLCIDCHVDDEYYPPEARIIVTVKNRDFDNGSAVDLMMIVGRFTWIVNDFGQRGFKPEVFNLDSQAACRHLASMLFEREKVEIPWAVFNLSFDYGNGLGWSVFGVENGVQIRILAKKEEDIIDEYVDLLYAKSVFSDAYEYLSHRLDNCF